MDLPELAAELAVEEYRQEYAQFRQQDQLRISYLQIYFSLVTVLLAATGLIFNNGRMELSLLALLAFGYFFLFFLGNTMVKVLIALRLVQLQVAFQLDLTRSHFISRHGLDGVLHNFQSWRRDSFSEPRASATLILRFVATVNAFAVVGAILFLCATIKIWLYPAPFSDLAQQVLAGIGLVSGIALVVLIPIHHVRALRRATDIIVASRDAEYAYLRSSPLVMDRPHARTNTGKGVTYSQPWRNSRGTQPQD